MQNHVAVNIYPERFAQNIRFLKQAVSPAKLCVVMKSDAYGHGLAELAPVAAAAGADAIGICSNDEARTLRQLLPNIPLIRLRSALKQEYDESASLLNLEEQVGSLEVAEYLHQLGLRRQRPIPVHIKIDTGMGRSGFFVEQQEAIKQVCQLAGLKVVGLMTHFASADDQDLAQTEAQLAKFSLLKHQLSQYLPADVLCHSHNSAASIRLKGQRADLVRIGAACYGAQTSQCFEQPAELQTVMDMHTSVMEVRDVPAGTSIGYGSKFTTRCNSRIASIPVGFGEGYPRALFNKGQVLINGQRCPVIGRVSLNITTIDITQLKQPVAWGDDVVLLGQQGDESISLEELAGEFDSVHTEINLMAGLMNQRSYL
ncbi:alanine racemase [Agarivorans aestuarii]|uniref:Alanine racemase n=1 Tax=Agarivorans aestuarii TaxID=1563703 RepID=A0ABU7GA28_9ALTE|nr:alanine racemase [Agarivorans aestuarii]MEE1676121.1 alanine racemase [Agarivorans aestuarii]